MYDINAKNLAFFIALDNSTCLLLDTFVILLGSILPFSEIYLDNNYFEIDDVRQRMIKENKEVFSNINIIKKNLFKKTGKKGNVLKNPFILPIENFYTTDAISSSSKIMKQCLKSSDIKVINK